MMNDPNDILAHLLAAEDHPHLKEEPAYLEAKTALEADPALGQRFLESKAFFQQHPVITRLEGMPSDCRERIEAILRAEVRKLPEGKVVTLSPWGIRKNFAWAAVLALLLAGMSVISSQLIQQQDRREKRLAAAREYPPQESFYQYAAQLAERRMPLQHRENGSTRLISWLENQGATSFSPPSPLLEKETMGCAYLDGPNGKVSLICFSTETGTVHLFVTCAKSLELESVSSPQPVTLNRRKALKWNDEVNAYLLITHDEEQELPEVFL